MKYNVMCRVSGGPSGTRQALLKRDGVVVQFDTENEAASEADDLRRRLNNEHSIAFFEYWAVPENCVTRSM